MILKHYNHIKSDSSIMGELARGSSGTFIVKISALAFSFILQVFLARILGVSEYGNFIFAVTLMSLCVLIGKMGLDTASIKYVASYNGKQDTSYLTGFIHFSNRMVILGSLIVGILVAFIVTHTNYQNTSSFQTTIWIVCLLLAPLNAFILTVVAQLRGIKHIVLPQAFADLFRPFFIILILAIMYVAYANRLNSVHAAIAHILSAMVIAVILTMHFRNNLRYGSHHPRRKYAKRQWITAAFPMLLIAIFNFVFAQADILLIGIIGDTMGAGLYAPAKRLANLVNLVLTSVNMISAPLIAELYAKNDRFSLQKTVRLSAIWIFLFSLPCCIVMFVFAKQLLLLFGPEFVDGYRSLRILSLSQLCNATAGTVGYLMIMTGFQSTASKVLGSTAALNIALNFILIPHLGILGAAYTNFISTFLWNALMLFFTLRCLKINPTIFQKHTRNKSYLF